MTERVHVLAPLWVRSGKLTAVSFRVATPEVIQDLAVRVGGVSARDMTATTISPDVIDEGMDRIGEEERSFALLLEAIRDVAPEEYRGAHPRFFRALLEHRFRLDVLEMERR